MRGKKSKKANKIRQIFIGCVFVFSINVFAGELLKSHILERNWEKLSEIFIDSSYKQLIAYFLKYKFIHIVSEESNRLNYKVKFEKYGEIGVIFFEKEHDKYFNAEIKNQIKPFYFIEKFKKYAPTDLKLSIGDAQIHFQSGNLYETIPFRSMLFFKGKWTFFINPSDEEERLTLERKFKKKYFSKINDTGIFILKKKEFLNSVPFNGEVTTLDEGIQNFFNIYRDNYGIKIKEFGEYWYLPFSRKLELAIFNKDKDSYYTYTYDNASSPDTKLVSSNNNSMLLAYNSIKGLKIGFGKPNQASNLELNLYLNPVANYVSGNSTISYAEPSKLKILKLKKELQLMVNMGSDAQELNILRQGEVCYFLGPASKTLSLHYKGYIKSDENRQEILKAPSRDGQEDSEQENFFYFLSKNQNFYPNPNNNFYKTNTTINLPKGYSCLVTGNLVDKKEGNLNTFKYISPGSKGISIVSGLFKKTKKLDAKIPINFYTFENFRYYKKLDLSEVKEAVNLFYDSFGSIGLSEINILLKIGRPEGGISNNGFIVVNLPPPRKTAGIYADTVIINTVEKRIISPILIRNQSEDHILHELAHQWWGGIISWKSYQEVWITEGLAHFSILYYLQKKLSERRFNRIIRKLKRWIFRHNGSGPVIYGSRIDTLENSYEAYQSIVYNKAAVIFLMLKNLIGEKEFTKRLRSVLHKYKYQSLTSMQFIREFSKKNKLLLNFFKKWIYSREIPVVKLDLSEEYKKKKKKDYKKVTISIKQLNTDHTFPLRLKVVTRKGTSQQSVIVKKKEQKFIIKRDSDIRSIDILNSISLVKEKKEISRNPSR